MQKLDVEDGFTDRNFYPPFQDRDGYMWFGNPFGLDRFDGTRVRHFRAVDHQLEYNDLFRITQDDQGMLWLHYNSSGQVLIFDPVNERTRSLTSYLGQSIGPSQITWVTQRPTGGMLWMTTEGEVYQWYGRKMEQVYQFSKENHLLQICEPKEGSIWINTSTEIIHFNEKWAEVERFEKEHNNEEVFPNLWRNPIEDKLGRLHYLSWPASRRDRGGKQQIFLFKRYTNGKLAPKHSEFKDYAVLGIEGASLNEYLFTEDHSGQYHFVYMSSEGEKLAAHPTTIRELKYSFFDSQNNCWLVTKDALFLIFCRQSLFTTYLQNDEIPGSAYSARGITEDHDGHLLINGSGHSYKLDKNTATLEEFSPPFLFNHVVDSMGGFFRSSFYKDDNGDIWITSEGFRLLKYDQRKNQFTQFTYTDSVFTKWLNKNNSPPTLNRAITRDQYGKLWVGHSEGLSLVNERENVVELLNNTGDMAPLAGAEVIFMHEKAEGIWLATSKGLYLFDSEQAAILEHYHSKAETEKRIPYDIIAHIYEDSEGVFWLGSKGGGLIKWNRKNKELEQFTNHNGLSNNVVYAVYEDSYKNLWLPTNEGLNQFNKMTGDVTQYNTSNGIAHDEFNTASHYRAADSTLYFGGLKGVTSFNPNHLVRHTTIESTPIILSGLQKQSRQSGLYENASRDLFETEQIVLSPNDVGFQLEFSHLDFRPDINKQYAYLIEGIDANWNYISTPSIRINALPYGQHLLKIRAEQSNRAWTPVLAVPILVNRPFYLQAWFMLLAVLLFSGGLYALFALKLRNSRRNAEQLEQEVQQRTSETIAQSKILKLQAQKLKKLDTAKSQFFANISHELRTPLTLIQGPLDQLIQDGQLNDYQLANVKRAAASGHNINQLVEEILELSKLEAGKLEVHEAPLILKPFLKRIFSAYHSMAERKQIGFYSHFSFSDNSSVYLDKKKVEKIINNLMSNALKYTPEGGTVTFSVTMQEAMIRMTVEDTGIGILSEDIPHIFDRYYQSQRTNLQGGTGIGLAFAKELTEVLGGTIGVESRPDAGSRFDVLIPEKKAQLIMPVIDESGEEHQNVGAESKKQTENSVTTILLVEDHPEMADFICQLLTPVYTVIIAYNGKEALKLLQTEEISLIISDVMMPEMDGLTLLRTLKASALYRFIPVIMLTAKAEERDKLDALTIGVDDYLTKPFLGDELKARVRNLLRNSINRTRSLLPAQEVLTDVLASEESSIGLTEEADIKWLRKFEKAALAKLAGPTFSIDLLAEDMEISARQMQRKLKHIVGMSPNQYVQELRLQLGLTYLENLSYHTIAEVAKAVGFRTTKYFSRLFKERYGKNPSNYLH